MADFTFTSKYARYVEDLNRRETWEEAVFRCRDMHLKKFNFLPEEDKLKIKEAFDLVLDKRIMPSMRSMQFGGKAIEAHQLRLYNCSVKHIDSIRSFAESFYTLLCGTGVGFGITNKYLNRLPDLISKKDAEQDEGAFTYVIQDSIEGWADSLEVLLMTYFKNTPFSGREVFFDYSHIRRKGSPLKTGGGKAPGYKGLKNSHLKIKRLLKHLVANKIPRLRTIDAYDILMFAADAVLSGGVRRSACAVIFDKTDDLMMKAKTGDWFQENPQRARSNNSFKISRQNSTLEDIKQAIVHTKQFGEPGFIFCDEDVIEDILYNPCMEICFAPVTAEGQTGFQMCNLTTINGAKVKTLDDFKKCAEFAAIIGTLQAAYTNFLYLSSCSRQLTEEEALLGVSITGIMDNPKILLDPKAQKTCAKICVDSNAEWAKKLNINQAARVTCIKPEGTVSIVLESASGIHPHHAHKYFRRIQVNKNESVYKHFKETNAHATEESVWSADKTDDVITFPIEISKDSMTKKDLTALQHLEIIKSTQQNWVVSGITPANKKNLCHNVSCTVLVDEDEWDKVAEYLYDNRHVFAAVSLLPKVGDKIYKQAPMEEVVTEEDQAKYDDLVKNWVVVDYSKLKEYSDKTTHSNEIACAGGSCDLIKM